MISENNKASRLKMGVFDVASRITGGLEAFIEAGYHLRDEALISERLHLLNEVGAIRQEPYIEATPSYRSLRSFSSLQAVPLIAREAYRAVAGMGLGLYDPPYEHQARALEEYFSGKDLIIATGTGSGKTESFLSAILGSLLLEATERPKTASLHGVRALLLYPMNALVNDQIFRIRKLFGDLRVADMLSAGRGGRRVTFASYTSRTPYHGRRTNEKDRNRVGRLLEEHYLRLDREQPELARELRATGRWPSKDLSTFFGGEHAVYGRNGQLRDGKWSDRLMTDHNDRELMTRHEVLAACPDIFVTNYSMLEYTLLRPFERPIFNATASWLSADDRNELIVVLDEAHLYRGAAGAEVALLLRRLAGRLGVSRDRLRFILTSASVGEGMRSDASILAFAGALSGLEGSGPRSFALIRGVPEDRPLLHRPLTDDDVQALAGFDLATFQESLVRPQEAVDALRSLAKCLRWREPPSAIEDVPPYLEGELTGLDAVEKLVTAVSGGARALGSLPAIILGQRALTTEALDAATATLIGLCSRASARGRNLLSARLHLFYRGLPALYACCDPKCDARRSDSGEAPLGRMYAEARLTCECSTHSRVFEVLSHRDCGATFIRGYVEDAHGQFVWSEPGAGARRLSSQVQGYIGSRLLPLEMLIDGEPHRQALEDHQARKAWLDVRTGSLSREDVHGQDGYREVWIPNLGAPEDRGLRFKPCPVCLRDWRETGRNEGLGLSKIEPHTTLGENPFTALTAAQLSSQPESLSSFARRTPERFPNRGRKVLVFSDGRQKAARLARDMPRMVQRDAFRQIIALATVALDAISAEATPGPALYTAIVSVLATGSASLFRGAAAQSLADDVRRYNRDFGPDELADAIREGAFTPSTEEYRAAVLEQLCGRYYSLSDATIGWLEPARRPLRRVLEEIGKIRPEFASQNTAMPLIYAWIGAALDGYALDESIPARARARAAGFGENRSDWRASGKFRSALRKALVRDMGWNEVEKGEVSKVEQRLAESFMHGAEKRFINPATVRVRVDLAKPWHQCRACFIIEPLSLVGGHCAHCGAPEPLALDPLTNTYLRARKGYWREPALRALRGDETPSTFSVAEHTAQLGHRESSEAYSTTERYELQFQDILVDEADAPIDVLSCTTTMEVGVDIGSLVAVALRNIPPERSNYQQRAGRAGRRGVGTSTVVTYGDRGPHGSYYFSRPTEIIAGPVRDPYIKLNSPKLARRHIHAILFQGYASSLTANDVSEDASIETSLGSTHGFFHSDQEPTIAGFRAWVGRHVTSRNGDIAKTIASWLPSELEIEHISSIEKPSQRRDEWVREVAADLIVRLEALSAVVPSKQSLPSSSEAYDADEPNESELAQRSVSPYLIGFLFDENLLPTYSFPTDLASFVVDEATTERGHVAVRVRQMPQQSISKAISEYAPGRLIVIDAATYRSGGVAARTLFSEEDRARPLFERITHLLCCDECGYLRIAQDKLEATHLATSACVTCSAPLIAREMIQPEVFTPEGRNELPDDDREQDLTYATSAQFPLPADGDDRLESTLTPAGCHVHYTHAIDQELVAVNKGLGQGPDANQGFFVCERCGKASIEQFAGRSHHRNYNVQGNAARNDRACSGTPRRVVLGNRFVSDVLLLRIQVAMPMIIHLTSPLEGRMIEDALASAAESLLLAASHYLDIDAQDFGVGYRIVPRHTGGTDENWRLDVYLYDTLSGGAGYAELVARSLSAVLNEALARLTECSCQRACTKCLRHFRNQHLHARLDRNLGAALLRWAIHGESPTRLSTSEQLQHMRPLQRLLQLEDIELQDRGAGIVACNRKTGVSVDVVLWPALLSTDRAPANHVIINDYLLSRDLPYEHERVRSALGLHLFPGAPR